MNNSQLNGSKSFFTITKNHSKGIDPAELGEDLHMCKVVATLKYLRANYSAQDSPERFLYEALSFLGMFRMIIIYI